VIRHNTSVRKRTAATTSDVSVDMKSWIANAVGEFRVVGGGGSTLDVVAGLRYLSLKERLEWNFTGSLGSLPESARSGDAQISSTIVDGIVGVKGQFRGDGGWSVPFYLDAGTLARSSLGRAPPVSPTRSSGVSSACSIGTLTSGSIPARRTT
jgi:hypothetical protein